MIFIVFPGYVLCKMPCTRIKQAVKRSTLVNVALAVFERSFFAML